MADTKDSNIFLSPSEKKSGSFTFEKYIDEKKDATQFVLNAIRVLPKYTEDLSNIGTEMQNAIKLYSRKVNLKSLEEN